MGVARSGYYSYLNRPLESKPNKSMLLLEVKALNQFSRGSYGSRQMSKNLQAKGYSVGRYQARSLMRHAGIECKQRRRYQITPQSDPHLPVAENTLNRDFKAQAVNQKWVADITYLWTQEGWLYLAAVLDLFSRRVVGWALADHRREELVSNALQMALWRRQPPKGLLHHSDRGCQYASAAYRGNLQEAGIQISMSRKGNCWDNAVMERFWGSLKSERTDQAIYPTRATAKADVIDYIEMFYNSQRLHSALGYVTPLQFEQDSLK